MSFTVFSGSFEAQEPEFCKLFLEALKSRKDPLRETILVVAPSAALRIHLLRLLYESDVEALYGVRFVSLNGLTQEIALETLEESQTALDDPIYFSLLVQSIARRKQLKQFEAYRTAKGLLATIRDVVDGLLTPELFQEFLDQAREDEDLRNQVGSLVGLQNFQTLLQQYLLTLKKQGIANIQLSAALAVDSVQRWKGLSEVSALFLYGFYDATPAQFELMETMIRQIHGRDGRVCFQFPFAIGTNSLVEHPAEYAQEFFDRLQSACASLGGEQRRVDPTPAGVSGGIESCLFQNVPADQLETVKARAKIEVMNCGSPQDEAWAVAKRILHLVLVEGIRFDQIAVVSRSIEMSRTTLQQLFAENCIPHTMPDRRPLSSTPPGQFLHLLAVCRQSYLNHTLLFELLCSPFLKEPFPYSGMIRELLEILFITNSNDWHRLKPLAQKGSKIPDIFELDEEDWRAQQYRQAAEYLLDFKNKIEQLPLQATIRDYASVLLQLMRDLGDSRRLQETVDIHLLLERLSEFSSEDKYSLGEFIVILDDYLQSTFVDVLQEEADARVTVADTMSLRGVPFDYVFLIGLNQDAFPVRITEDPFLPDHVRRAITSVTGAGPYPKRRISAVGETIKESDEEELLLFGLALRSAKRNLCLSYLRADSDGKKQSPSIYVEELLRIQTSQTAEKNESVEQIPRHYASRFRDVTLPTPSECAILTARYSPSEVLPECYGMRPDYVSATRAFAAMLNSTERSDASEVDGCMPDSTVFWKDFADGQLRYSYTRIKDYVNCPFSFFSDRILRLQSSPFEPTEIAHDLTALVKGRMAESVVKEAIPKLRLGTSIEEAIQHASARVRRKYASYLPKLVLEIYLSQFSRGAQRLLEFLQEEGYDFAYAEVPGREYDPKLKLVEDDSGSLTVYGIPDLLFYGQKKLIGEMKWGSPATSETTHAMFNRGEFQFCIYPELERSHRQLLETADFRYFRLNAFADMGSPSDMEEKLRAMGSPQKIDVTLRIFGNAPTSQEVAAGFERLKGYGRGILRSEFRILKDPSDFFSPCSYCRFVLICRRNHSATLLRAKDEQRETNMDEPES